MKIFREWIKKNLFQILTWIQYNNQGWWILLNLCDILILMVALLYLSILYFIYESSIPSFIAKESLTLTIWKLLKKEAKISLFQLTFYINPTKVTKNKRYVNLFLKRNRIIWWPNIVSSNKKKEEKKEANLLKGRCYKQTLRMGNKY